MVDLGLDAAIKDVLDLCHDTVKRQTISGDTAGHGASQLRPLFKNGYIVTQFVQVIGCCQSTRTTANYGDTLSTARLTEAAGFPGLLCVMLYGKAFQITDGKRAVQPAALAACFT